MTLTCECGQSFEYTRGPKTGLCPECRKRRKNKYNLSYMKRKTEKICIDCDQPFLATPNAERCPECKELRRKEIRKENYLKNIKGRRVYRRPHPEAGQYDFSGNNEFAIYCQEDKMNDKELAKNKCSLLHNGKCVFDGIKCWILEGKQCDFFTMAIKRDVERQAEEEESRLQGTTARHRGICNVPLSTIF